MTARRAPAAELADIREQIAGIAEVLSALTRDADLVEIIRGAKRAGYDDALADLDDYKAIARAQERRRQFRLVAGGAA